MVSYPHTAKQSDPLKEALETYKLQKSAYLTNQYPALKSRMDNLKQLEAMLLNHMDGIAQASCADYGNRAHQEVLLAEIFTSVDGIRHTRKMLRKWMKPERRGNSIWFMGVKNSLIAQPKGVVGVISPWNYPLFLFISPVTSALAAGNRCIIKMAKESSNLAELMTYLVQQYFPEDTLAIIPDISGSEFTQLPFDHLVFTGSANTARQVMTAAAQTLTPVTLELGGKCPCIIDKEFDLQVAARRIINFKTFNAGQTCVAPDYVFVHEDQLQSFIKLCGQTAQSQYNSIHSKDYTSIISDNAMNRLTEYLEEAQNKGAKLHNLMGDSAVVCDQATRKLSPMLISHAPDDCRLMQEEIFGPLLPVKTYNNINEVIDYINQRANPLALYLFSKSNQLQKDIIFNTLSGAVGINDCVLHVAQHHLPFGGIGESGMGHYHAEEGFKEFSKLRPVFKQARFASSELLSPPYGASFDFIMKAMLKLKL